jgi:hypothetical protein
VKRKPLKRFERNLLDPDPLAEARVNEIVEATYYDPDPLAEARGELRSEGTNDGSSNYPR